MAASAKLANRPKGSPPEEVAAELWIIDVFRVPRCGGRERNLSQPCQKCGPPRCGLSENHCEEAAREISGTGRLATGLRRIAARMSGCFSLCGRSDRGVVELKLVDAAVNFGTREEFLVAASGHDAALVHDDNAVGLEHR